LASNPAPQIPASANSITADRAGQIVGTVAAVVAEIEQLIAASGVVGGQTMPQIEQLTALFGNLAGVAIQAAHDVMGKPVTPDSVLTLMPVATALVDPPGSAPSGA
jgi:phage-related minor tail protein